MTDVTKLQSSDYDGAKNTVILIHGFKGKQSLSVEAANYIYKAVVKSHFTVTEKRITSQKKICMKNDYRASFSCFCKNENIALKLAVKNNEQMFTIRRRIIYIYINSNISLGTA